MRNIIIVGGGAAGLMAAVSAAKSHSDAKITVIEKNARPGRKLMITGKGRCNVTNNCDIDTLISNTAKNARFLYSAFCNFSSADTMNFFENAGVPLKTERGNRVFPVSDKASDIVDALYKEVKKSGAEFMNGTVTSVATDNGKVTGVKLQNGEYLPADSVLIATGGASYLLTGSTGDGYGFAKESGHTVTEIKPSLVPLCCHEGFCTKLSGLTLKNVTLSLFEEGKDKPLFKEMGEMLFTHFGVSGPLVLSASAYIKDLRKTKYTCFIDLKPALTFEQLDSRILRDFSEFSNKNFSNSLNKILPKTLIPVIVSLSGIDPEVKTNQVSREERQKLVSLLKNFKLTVTGTRPLEEAIITSGGVSVREINPKTMESKLISGLFFAGEVIDVDAFTGGFNLQIAFSTGYTAGLYM